MTTRNSRVTEERAGEASADLVPRPESGRGDPRDATPDGGRTRPRSSRRESGRGRRSRPRTRPDAGRAAQPRRREVDGEAEAVAGAGDAKRRALPASGSPWTREGRGRRSRTGSRGPRAGGARARRLFGFRRGGEPPSHSLSAPTTRTTEGGGDGPRGTIEVVQGGGFSRRPGRASERRRSIRRKAGASRSGVPRGPSPPPVPDVLSSTRDHSADPTTMETDGHGQGHGHGHGSSARVFGVGMGIAIPAV